MSTPQAIAVRGIRGRGPAGIGEHVVTTDKNGQFVFKNIIGFATKNDVASGAYSPQSANPTAVAKDTAVNGTAKSFMTSDSAPAVQKTSSLLFGIAKVDGTTIIATAGVINALAQCHVYLPCLVADLPAGVQGDRGFVTDATTTLALGLGLAPVGSGANETPVYRDSAGWKIG